MAALEKRTGSDLQELDKEHLGTDATQEVIDG